MRGERTLGGIIREESGVLHIRGLEGHFGRQTSNREIILLSINMGSNLRAKRRSISIQKARKQKNERRERRGHLLKPYF